MTERDEGGAAGLARRLLAAAADAAAADGDGGPALIARAAEHASTSGLPPHEVALARLLALGAYFDGRGDGARGVPDRLAAAARALHGAHAPVRPATDPVYAGPMKLSARNQIPARITGITRGEAIANVRLEAAGVPLAASITVEAADELGLAEGQEVVAVIKASDVMIGRREG